MLAPGHARFLGGMAVLVRGRTAARDLTPRHPPGSVRARAGSSMHVPVASHVRRVLLRAPALALLALALLSRPDVAPAQDAPGPVDTPFVALVVDASTGLGIPDASVSAPGTGRSARTNAVGFAVIAPLPGERQLRVRVERIGYQPADATLQVGSPPIRVELRPVAIPIEGVEVRSILARESTPGAFTNVDRRHRADHWGQDMPMLLGATCPAPTPTPTRATASATRTSRSAASRSGGSACRSTACRSTIPSRTRSTGSIIPTLASSAHEVQVQRGVGSALYGDDVARRRGQCRDDPLPDRPRARARSGRPARSTRSANR